MDGYILRQIIPAHDVDAVFLDAKSGQEISYPVVCWALKDIVKDDCDPPERYQDVVGMMLLDGVGYLDFAQGGEGENKFLRYEYKQ